MHLIWVVCGSEWSSGCWLVKVWLRFLFILNVDEESKFTLRLGRGRGSSGCILSTRLMPRIQAHWWLIMMTRVQVNHNPNKYTISNILQSEKKELPRETDRCPIFFSLLLHYSSHSLLLLLRDAHNNLIICSAEQAPSKISHSLRVESSCQPSTAFIKGKKGSGTRTKKDQILVAIKLKPAASCMHWNSPTFHYVKVQQRNVLCLLLTCAAAANRHKCFPNATRLIDWFI